MRNPCDLISHVPVQVFDLDLESGGVKWAPPQALLPTTFSQINVSLAYANIDRQRPIRMLNLPQFIVVCFTFSTHKFGIHFRHFFFWLPNKSQNWTASG